MSNNNARAFSEVDSILNCLNSDYINMLPKEIIDLIKKNKDDSYQPKYTLSKEICEQKISILALSIITWLNLKYWCNIEDKSEILKILENNEKKYQNEMKIKENLIFNADEKKIDAQKSESISLVTPPKNVFLNFWNKIINFFTKKGI